VNDKSDTTLLSSSAHFYAHIAKIMSNITQFFKHQPSPLQRIEHDLLATQKISLFIKRDDLLHPEISGNKWRKLKYNAFAAEQQGKNTLRTYGGAYSNHIYAVAALGKAIGCVTKGIILMPGGERPKLLTSTLQFAENCGMELQFVSKEAYKILKNNSQDEHKNIFLIPEGGSNCHALLGCAEIVTEVQEQINFPFDYWCVSGGTGGTAAGILTALPHKAQLLVFSALQGNFLKEDITQLLKTSNTMVLSDWQLLTAYHFGGYAKYTNVLLQFIADFRRNHGILLDPIYTGKLLFGVFDLAKQGFFPEGSRIVAIHTGGIQGWSGKIGQDFLAYS
jgi:1-aminocyclopropane-1-carboxylate deaminase/D-cysteine desulfhydrase-like pyridoxal-dependent ACC family enzyme